MTTQKGHKYAIRTVLAIIVILAYGLSELDDKIWYYLHDLTTSDTTKQNAIWLPNYRISQAEIRIPGVTNNASGLTYNNDTDTLWVIVNSPTYLVELDLSFNLLRKVELENFKDTEAIAYIGNNQFVITDERDQTIMLATVGPEIRQIDKNDLEQITLNIYGYGNKGLEGIAHDPSTNSIYTVRERDPIALIKLTGFIENNNRIKVEKADKINVDSLYLDDLSGLHFDSESGHLLFLSDESKLLVEVDLEGNKISYMDLEKGFNALKKSIPQAEGVTLDNQANLYIVSEPNLLYRFEPTNQE